MNIDSSLLALYGAIISTAVAIIQFYNYLKSKGSLSLEIDPMHGSYYIRSNRCVKINYAGNYFLILSVKISNKSSQPVTVDGVYLLNSLKKPFYSDSHIHIEPHMYLNHDVSFNEKILEFPIKLSPYDSVKGSLFFSLDHMYQMKDVISSKPQHIKIYIETPRGTYSHQTVVLSYESYMARHLERNRLLQSKRLQ